MTNRILVVVNHFYPYIGGLENSVLELYGKMKILYPEMEIDVICNNTERVIQQERYRGLNIHRMECWNILGHRYSIPKPFSMMKTFNDIRQNDYGYVNAHTRFFINSLIAFLFARMHKIMYVHTEQGASFTKLDNRLVSWMSYLVDQTVGRLILTFADRVVAISTAAGSFARRLGARDYRVIHHGVESKNRVFDGRFTSKEPGSLIAVGRLVYGKGIQDLLLVLKDIDLPFRLRIVGDGMYRNELEKRIQAYRLEDRVEFCGFLDSDDVHRLLAKSQVFINPTYTEGFGITTIEAGLEGCAIVASNVGGQADIIDEGVDGFLIDGFERQEPERFDLLRERLVQLLGDRKLCKTLGERIQQKVMEEFSWEKAAKAYAEMVK